METERTELYRDESYRVEAVDLTLENGAHCRFPLTVHPGGVVILALDRRNRVALVRQRRYAIGKETMELPAGKLDKVPNETPLSGAKRELREEAGCLARSWQSLGSIYPSPGILSEELWLFLATDIVPSSQDLDDDEILTVEWVDLPRFEHLVFHQEIQDAKTICAYALAKGQGFLDSRST
jgi:ADP-ribose pyrophosphatase